ncbi:peptidase S10 [Rhodoblastus acidophilus]|uniref:Peptidase S10 n=1 Tax=Rhodoblastus acidophilus TaxID=1074 RepID=A0A6N8DTL7_RHOAC|nr:peptidase S10 [Rhodoblastus acidophilus]MCW2276067.1 carboxypeptidase C (cathepsin A) [Rhodoblastus acidophilus]MTV33156.1 peptidase S10 [Rhodoblastus acidophilus]
MTRICRRPRGGEVLLAFLLLPLLLGLNVARAENAGPPTPSVTEHSIAIGDRKIAFKATASTVPVKDAQSGETLADVATLAFTRDAATCRVVFAFNGGPGAGSAWLDLGAVGPWRLPLAGAVPSTPPRLVDNQESWLDFTDLVFIDPPGTGFSRLPANESAKKHFLSVDGDIDMLAAVIRRWSEREHRETCAKYLLGESYGGFRAPKIARALQESKNVGVDGLILVSPVLDFAWIEGRNNPLVDAARLPSLVASRTGAKNRAALADAESFARGDYITDLLRGPNDEAALGRVVGRLSTLTGLPAETLRRLGGRVGTHDWARETDPTGRTIASAYDGAVRGLNPSVHYADVADPVLDALRAPLAQAMSRLTAEKLKRPVGDVSYEILNDRVSHGWDWGQGRRSQESLSDLRHVMALDPRVKILVAHGLSDLVTPYFATRLLLDQSLAVGAPDRIGFIALPGGHMFYAEEFSRAAFRDAARKMIEGN